MVLLMDDLDRRILALLAAGLTGSRPIAAAIGVRVRTVQYRLGRLRDAGLVESPTRGDWRPTGAGSRAALAATIPEPASSLGALDALPAEHRAVLRLIEDAVVARRKLETVYPTNWPGFVLLGRSGSGKSLIADLAARRFGLDPTSVVLDLEAAKESDLLGRLEQDPGRVWRRTASPLARPLLILEEYDKAPAGLRPVIFACLAGKSRQSLGSETIEVHATVVVSLNDDRSLARLLSDAHLRRSVVLDTGAAATADLDETARHLIRAELPLVPASLAPPADELPEAARVRLRSVLWACLTTRGWGLVDVEAISRLALGRWAHGPVDPEGAALVVAADYLLVTATRPGLVVADWAARFEAESGRLGAPITGVLDDARERQATAQGRQVVAEREALDARLELAGARERLHAGLAHELRTAPRGELTAGERATKDEARGKARLLLQAIAGARSLATLGELEERCGREVRGPLQSVAAALEGRRQAAEQARQLQGDGRRQAAERVRAGRAATQAAQRAAKSRHAAVQALYRRTVARPGEAVLAELAGARCVTPWSEQYEEETLGSRVGRSGVGRGIRSLLGSASPPPEPEPPADPWGLYPEYRQPPPAAPSGPAPRYVTKTQTWYEDRSGRQYEASDLAEWGSAAVRAVLEAAAAAEGLPPLTLPKRAAGRSGAARRRSV